MCMARHWPLPNQDGCKIQGTDDEGPQTETNQIVRHLSASGGRSSVIITVKVKTTKLGVHDELCVQANSCTELRPGPPMRGPDCTTSIWGEDFV